MSINTVCMTIVASRNLTTLFASLCMLHPEIQVLNHFPSINNNPNTNFLIQYSDDKLENFVKKVDQINKDSVKIPREGGVITKAHAFNSDEDMRNAFFDRFSGEHKRARKSIVWKDSYRNTLALQKCDLDHLFSNTDKLRFILTVRNPMDCAVSSSKSRGYSQYFRDGSKEGILQELFERYEWFFDLQERFPEYFMCFFEFDPSDDLLNRLQSFLRVGNDEVWKKDFLRLWKMKSTYNHSHEFKAQYLSHVEGMKHTGLREKFERYAQ